MELSYSISGIYKEMGCLSYCLLLLVITVFMAAHQGQLIVMVTESVAIAK